MPGSESVRRQEALVHSNSLILYFVKGPVREQAGTRVGKAID